MRLDEMAARTPVDRDRYVDFLRALSITVVVLGHWLIAIIDYSNGYVRVYSAVGVTRGLWLLTWFLQVMPLFFFVGGFSNLKTYDASRRKGESYARFMRARRARLLTPTAVFLGVWVVIQIALEPDALRKADGEVIYRKCAAGEHHHRLVCRRCRVLDSRSRTTWEHGPAVTTSRGSRTAWRSTGCARTARR